jgi:stearoyl-CoA desaturase (delta-9 desaturase)
VVQDLSKYPELCLMDRFSVFVPIASGFFMFGLGWGLNGLFPSLETSGMQMLIWGFFLSTVAVFHGTCTINSLCHIWGRKRYKSQDESRNSLLLALITLGEGWHNNHHYYPGTARQGFYWWEIDITYYLLKMLSWAGLIWDVRKMPKEKRDDIEAMIRPPRKQLS